MSFANTRLTLFAILSAIEDDLREIFVEQLSTQVDAESLFPKELYEKCLERYSREEGYDAKPTAADLIIYSDLGDLCPLLNAHRKYLPESVARCLRELSLTFEQLVPIRNRVYHNRPLTFSDYPTTINAVETLTNTSSIPWSSLKLTMKWLCEEPQFVLGLEIPAYESTVHHNLPSPDFDETGFLGREEETAKLSKLCLGPYPVISVLGVGGVGKTALAVKVAYDLADHPAQPFDAIVWCTSKTMQLTPTEIIYLKSAIHDSLGMLDQLATELTGMKPSDAMYELLAYMSTFRILVILDNLETVLDDRIKEFLEKLPEGSKVLITSRIGVGAYDFPLKLEPLTKDNSVQLLRALARSRDLGHLVETNNKQLGVYCDRLNCNPGFLKWFVSAVQAGVSPEDALANPELFLDFCMANVFEHLTNESRLMLQSMLVVTSSMSQAEMAFVLEWSALQVKKSLQDLLTTNMIHMDSKPRGHSYVTQYSVSEMARGYLNSKHPIGEEQYKKVSGRVMQLAQLAEEMASDKGEGRYSAFNISLRTTHDLVIARYLRDAMTSIHNHKYEAAAALVSQAKELAPDYYEVHRVEAWLHSYKDNVPAAKSAYDAAVQLEPGSTPLRFWYGQFLLRINETSSALNHLRIALEGDPSAVEIQVEIARCELYQYHFQASSEVTTPLLTRDDLSERTRRIVWDLHLQIYRREADYLIHQKESEKALDAYEAFRNAYEKCPKVLIDTRMHGQIGNVGFNLKRLCVLLARTKGDQLQKRASDLADWIEAEGFRLPSERLPLVEGDRKTGKITKLLREKSSFGFIEVDENRTSLFFHQSNLEDGLYVDWLIVGFRVSFTIGKNHKGQVADKIQLLDDPIDGNTLSGQIRMIERQKDFAFVSCEDGRRFYTNRTYLIDNSQWDQLLVGKKVTFKVGKKDGRLVAEDVLAILGQPMAAARAGTASR